jgi:hypothetical protein
MLIGMNNASLSFAVLEERIRSMPDGPAAVLTTPRWLAPLNVLGTIGVILAILPFLMIQFLTPQLWMVWVARAGLCMVVFGYIPSIIQSAGVLCWEFWRWKPKLVEQSDHDLAQFRELRQWLRKFPRADLEDHHRFAVLSQGRVSAKLGVLQGGFDKLGVLPALLALFFLIKNSGGLSIDALLATPYWQSWAALLFAITYLVSFLAILMRLRLQLYEVVLADALNID